jgi:uncharacterized protein YbbK (DUF523 family)
MQNQLPRPLFLVSACLVGLCTRYDKSVKGNDSCLRLLQDATWIPVCPEQLGGLPTPREAADIIGGDGNDVLLGNASVVTKSGINVTPAFINGAYQVLAIAQSQRIEAVFLKARSPSCSITGCTGVTAALLRLHGFRLREF